MRKIFVVILHYGDILDTLNTVKSLEKFKKSYDNLIVINNDPKVDLSKTELADKTRILINNNKNLGFAGGVNVGLKHAIKSKANYVVVLNNDTVIGSEFITPIVDNMENNKSVGITSPIIEFLDNNQKRYDYGGKIIKLIGKTIHDNRLNNKDKSLKYTDYVSGCCMIISRKVLEKNGYFDESFFLYYEDVDYCIRAKKAGFLVCVDPNSQIKHHLSKSVGKFSNNKMINLIKSGKIFSNKYSSSFPLMKLFLVWQTLIFLIKSPSSYKTIMKGWME